MTALHRRVRALPITSVSRSKLFPYPLDQICNRSTNLLYQLQQAERTRDPMPRAPVTKAFAFVHAAVRLCIPVHPTTLNPLYDNAALSVLSKRILFPVSNETGR